MDAASYTLIAQLQLDDLNLRLADEPFALQLQAEEYSSFVQNFQVSSSFQEAAEKDREIIERVRMIDQGVEDDRRYAEALSRGEELPQPSEAQRAMENARPHQEQRVECVSCLDLLSPPFLRAPCNHVYCVGCLEDLVKAALNDESLHPLRCCRQSLEIPRVVFLLPRELQVRFLEKLREFGTNASERVYCPNPTCSKFLGSSASHPSRITCPLCWTSACTLCKQRAHRGDTCAQNTALEQVKELATERGWQTCPGCHAIVELNIGCYHMTCRCRTEFCYLCAVPWKNCTCPQWEEQRLLVTAETHVEREVGQNMRVAEPEVYQQRVEHEMVRLQDYHDRAPHSWHPRDMSGICEECGFSFRYLMVRDVDRSPFLR
ncbi:hypothetical protein D9758_013793 [Tetrapyrgos nigripes]|uniref:RBR-type E3 ubiquitin transferase n=1 Tax=Tetrapyrgos nigripes TaxID=182062 RepID=A0A8H5D4R2_9AGAR|nr:hypothetical protein D9758_013793 [Tetrapyrgos nigripes]